MASAAFLDTNDVPQWFAYNYQAIYQSWMLARGSRSDSRKNRKAFAAWQALSLEQQIAYGRRIGYNELDA